MNRRSFLKASLLAAAAAIFGKKAVASETLQGTMTEIYFGPVLTPEEIKKMAFAQVDSMERAMVVRRLNRAHDRMLHIIIDPGEFHSDAEIMEFIKLYKARYRP